METSAMKKTLFALWVSAGVLFFYSRGYADEKFTDVTASSGIGEFKTGSSGVSWGDYNNDKWEDLLLVSAWVKLFRNRDGHFEDVTVPAGLGNVRDIRAGYWGDYDNDGDMDLFFTPCRLFKNNKGVFEEVTQKARLPDLGKYMIESAAWGDYDGDGNIDLVVPCIYPKEKPWTPAPVFLFKNNGDGTFTDVTQKAGFPDPDRPEREPRGVAWCDYDNDGDLDLYVTCYRLYADYLFRNNGDGTFTNVAKASGFPQQSGQTEANGHELGVLWADFNRDGFFDLYMTPQHDGNRLYQNQGPPQWHFANVANEKGALSGSNRFNPGGNNEHLSCASADYDNDGWPDLYVTMEGEGKSPNQLLHNKGDGTFERVTDRFDLNHYGHAAAWCDYDHDGDPDLIAAGESSSAKEPKSLPVKLYRNDIINKNHWIYFRLAGTRFDSAHRPEPVEGKSNRSAIGARVTVVTGSLTQIQEVDGGSGSMSQNSMTLAFGLGAATKVDKVTVRWPGGKTQDVIVKGVDKIITVPESSAAK